MKNIFRYKSLKAMSANVKFYKFAKSLAQWVKPKLTMFLSIGPQSFA